MSQTKKKLLIVQTKAPFGSSSIQESLDLVLAAGTFDQDVSLLIEGDACFQLLSNQMTSIIGRKNTSKMLNALPIYGIDNIFVCEESALNRKINLDEVKDTFKLTNKNTIKALYKEADNVIRF